MGNRRDLPESFCLCLEEGERETERGRVRERGSERKEFSLINFNKAADTKYFV